MIPGFQNAMGGFIGNRIGMSFIGSIQSDGNGPSLELPAISYQAGDLLIAFSKGDQGTAYPTAAYGTGFTAIGTATFDDSGLYIRVGLSYKIATGSEGTTFAGFISANDDGGAIAVYRPNVAITSVTVNNLNTQGALGKIADQTINGHGKSYSNIAVFGYAERGSACTVVPSLTLDDQEATDEFSFGTLLDPSAALTLEHVEAGTPIAAAIMCELQID